MPRKKKIGIRLKVNGGMNKYGDDNPDWWGEIQVLKDGNAIGGAGFTVSDLEIYVDSLNMDAEYQCLGYGSMIMDVIKGLSRFLRKPIILYSVGDSLPYYEKMEFCSCLDEKYSKKIVFNSDDPDPSDKDLIWIPECLRRRKILVNI